MSIIAITVFVAGCTPLSQATVQQDPGGTDVRGDHGRRRMEDRTACSTRAAGIGGTRHLSALGR